MDTFIGVLDSGRTKEHDELMGIGGYYQTIILGLLLVITVLADRTHFDQHNKTQIKKGFCVGS